MIQSTATGTLETPPISTLVHIFKDEDLDRPLLSTADFCNKGCTAVFTSTSAIIIHDASRRIILRSTKEPTARLWPSFPESTTVTQAEPIVHSAALLESNKDFVAYMHAALGSPTDNSVFTAFPRYISAICHGLQRKCTGAIEKIQ